MGGGRGRSWSPSRDQTSKDKYIIRSSLQITYLLTEVNVANRHNFGIYTSQFRNNITQNFSIKFQISFLGAPVDVKLVILKISMNFNANIFRLQTSPKLMFFKIRVFMRKVLR